MRFRPIPCLPPNLHTRPVSVVDFTGVLEETEWVYTAEASNTIKQSPRLTCSENLQPFYQLRSLGCFLQSVSSSEPTMPALFLFLCYTPSQQQASSCKFKSAPYALRRQGATSRHLPFFTFLSLQRKARDREILFLLYCKLYYHHPLLLRRQEELLFVCVQHHFKCCHSTCVDIPQWARSYSRCCCAATRDKNPTSLEPILQWEEIGKKQMQN